MKILNALPRLVGCVCDLTQALLMPFGYARRLGPAFAKWPLRFIRFDQPCQNPKLLKLGALTCPQILPMGQQCEQNVMLANLERQAFVKVRIPQRDLAQKSAAVTTRKRRLKRLQAACAVFAYLN